MTAPRPEKIAPMLDRDKLHKLSPPLRVQVVRLLEGGEVGSAIPLDREGRNYSYEEVEAIDVQTVPRLAGGGWYLASVSSESDPGSAFKWKFNVQGAPVIPVETRRNTVQAEIASAGAQIQAAQQMAQMPFGSSQPSPGQPVAAMSPWPGQQTQASPWPFMFGWPQPQAPAVPVEDQRLRILEEQNRTLREQAQEEKRQRELQAAEQRAREERDRQAREFEAKLAADRAAADQRHRELMEVLKGAQAKPAVDPAEVERRLREEFRAEMAQRAASEAHERSLAETRREIEAIRAESARQQQEMQKQLAEAQRRNDAVERDGIMQRMVDMQASQHKEMLALVERLNDKGKADPIDLFVKLQGITKDGTKDKLADFALEMMQNPGGGTAQVVSDIVGQAGNTVREIVRDVATYKAGQTNTARREQARARFAQIGAQPSPKQVETRRAQGLGGMNGAAARPTPAPTPPPASPPGEKPPCQAHLDDRTYFGQAFPNVDELRTAVRSGQVNDYRLVVKWIVDGYMQLTGHGIEIPALDDMEHYPVEFVKKLLPMIDADKIKVVAETYPGVLRAKLDEEAAAQDDAPPAEDEGNGDDEPEDEGDGGEETPPEGQAP